MKKYKFSTLNKTKFIIIIAFFFVIFFSLFIIIDSAVDIYKNGSPWIGYLMLLFYGVGGAIYIFCLIKRICRIPYVTVTEDCILKMEGKKIFAKFEFQSIISIQKIDESTNLIKYEIITQEKKEEIVIPFSLYKNFEMAINQYVKIGEI